MSVAVLLIKKESNRHDLYFKKIFDEFYLATTMDDACSIVGQVSLDLIIWDTDFSEELPYSFFEKNISDKVIALFALNVEREDLKKAMNMGLRFCLDKGADPARMADAVTQLYQFCQKWKRERILLNRFVVSANTNKILCSKFNLSSREIEVVNNSLDSSDYNQIASRLYISKGTVKRHLHNIYRKIDINSKAELKNFIYNLNTCQISSFQNFREMT